MVTYLIMMRIWDKSRANPEQGERLNFQVCRLHRDIRFVQRDLVSIMVTTCFFSSTLRIKKLECLSSANILAQQGQQVILAVGHCMVSHSCIFQPYSITPKMFAQGNTLAYFARLKPGVNFNIFLQNRLFRLDK